MGRGARFQVVDAEAKSLIDLETRSTWDPYGLCVKGPLKGTQLKPLILIPEFWFKWSQFRPGTRVFTMAEERLDERTTVGATRRYRETRVDRNARRFRSAC
jgi:Protein of unknown function (DUF3179)